MQSSPRLDRPRSEPSLAVGIPLDIAVWWDDPRIEMTEEWRLMVRPDRIVLRPEDRERALASIRAHLADTTGEEAGELAALLWLDLIAEQIGPYYFNEGVVAAQRLVARVADGLDADFDAMKRLPPRS